MCLASKKESTSIDSWTNCVLHYPSVALGLSSSSSCPATHPVIPHRLSHWRASHSRGSPHEIMLHRTAQDLDHMNGNRPTCAYTKCRCPSLTPTIPTAAAFPRLCLSPSKTRLRVLHDSDVNCHADYCTKDGHYSITGLEDTCSWNVMA